MDDYVGGKKMAGTILNYYDDDDDGAIPSQRDMWTSKWGKEEFAATVQERQQLEWVGGRGRLWEWEKGDWCNSLKEGSRTFSLDTA